MTIHKSKGLEFDCVILPSLGSRPSRQDTPLLRWLHIPSQEHGELLLLSPIKAAHHEHCLLYNYLGKLNVQKNNYELQRLLYVAATRAKNRLYLFDNHETIHQGTFRHLLQRQVFSTSNNPVDIAIKAKALPRVYHLPISYYEHLPEQAAIVAPSRLNIADSSARLIGIITHELLQWICDKHPGSLKDIPWTLATHQLKAWGFNALELQAAEAKIQRQITQFFNDSIGQWIIQSHEDERNEYELLVLDDQSIVTKIIDRTFCDQGIRWIIDFKTGYEDKQNQMRYKQQVNDYARLFAARDREKTIHCGLYYLDTNHWVTWAYDYLGVTN